MTDTTQRLVRAMKQATAVVQTPALRSDLGDLSISDPGIQIQGLGPMPFPLKVRDLKQIRPFAQQAPYGKGTQTLVDTSVRNTWEIEADQFEVSQPFKAAIRDVVPKVAAELGLPGSDVVAEPYKLLIYEKGGRFDWHRDAEKQKGMVGSLIVVLPCKFGGGALDLRNPTSNRRCDFRKARLEKSAQYAAFYADTEHSVSRVTSGVRVCLAYNLVLKTKPKARPKSEVSGRQGVVARAVRRWMDENAAEPMVVAFEHQYTEAGLSMRLLKGVDREIAESMELAAEQLGCHLHLGMVSRHLCQFADDGSFGHWRRSSGGRRAGAVNIDNLDVGDVYEDEIVVEGWKDPHGAAVSLGPLSCDASSLVSLTPFQQWKPTSQDYEGYTGNAGNTLDRWYHKSALVIWADHQHFEFVTRSGRDYAVALFSQMRNELIAIDDEDELEVCCDELYRFARTIIEKWPTRYYQRNGFERVTSPSDLVMANELVSIEDPDLVGEWLDVVAVRDWLLSLDKWVPRAIKTLGADEVIPLLRRLLKAKVPPNQYGRVIAEGLPERDAAWLLKLCEKSETLSVSWQDCTELTLLAINRFATDVLGRREAVFHRDSTIQATWFELVKVAMTLEHLTQANSKSADFAGTGILFDLLDQPSKSFDLRGFQVDACIKMIRWVQKKLGAIPQPIQQWRGSIHDQLSDATEREPQPPTNQTRAADVDCDCRYCVELIEFLVDPTKTTATIRARQDRREHVQRVIDRNQLDVATSTLRTGTPHGLVMDKTQDSYQRYLKRYREDLKRISRL